MNQFLLFKNSVQNKWPPSFQINQSYSVAIKFYEDGVQNVLASGTVMIFDSNGNLIQQSDGTEWTSQALSVDADGTASFTLDGSTWFDTEDSDEDRYHFKFSLTDSNGLIHIRYREFFISKYVWESYIIDADLSAREPEIATLRYSDWTTFSTVITAACSDMYDLLIAKNVNVHQVWDFQRMRKLQILKTLELIYFGASNTIEDIYWAKFLKYKKEFNFRWAALINTIKQDSDESGEPEEPTSVKHNTSRVVI